MKRLILMRHAKSDWSDKLPDKERPLNGRGRRSAKAMGKWLRDMGHLPDQVLCSSATRTRETLERLTLQARTSYQKALYLADAAQMLDVLRLADGETVLMIGHNPGIGDLAHSLMAQHPDHPRWSDYPTCATLVATFDIDAWEALQPGTGRLADFIVARDLTD